MHKIIEKLIFYNHLHLYLHLKQTYPPPEPEKTPLNYHFRASLYWKIIHCELFSAATHFSLIYLAYMSCAAVECAYINRRAAFVVLHRCIKIWGSGADAAACALVRRFDFVADHFLLAGSDALRGAGGLASSSAARAINLRCFSEKCTQ